MAGYAWPLKIALRLCYLIRPIELVFFSMAAFIAVDIISFIHIRLFDTVLWHRELSSSKNISLSISKNTSFSIPDTVKLTISSRVRTLRSLENVGCDIVIPPISAENYFLRESCFEQKRRGRPIRTGEAFTQAIAKCCCIFRRGASKTRLGFQRAE
jgi:hypothetical protein